MNLHFPDLLFWPLMAALVLTGIHVYLGIHVIGRKVIFVDLALAQIAALGAAFGVLMGYEIEHSPAGLFLYSLAFTVLAALIFSITKLKSDEIPHEAIIGITYAVAVATTMIVLARSPLGPNEFDRMMKGELLYVTRDKVLLTAGIYAAVGIFHGVFRKQFFALSFGNRDSLRRPRLWDFFFYASFGFVVTSSVAIAGVFLVFCLLVIPAVGALLFAERTLPRLAIGWFGGALICLLGLKVAWEQNLPPSPLIVFLFASVLMVAALVKYFLRASSKVGALIRTVSFALVFLGFGAGVWVFRHRGEEPFEQALHFAHSEDETRKLTALNTFEAYPERKEKWLPHALTLLADRAGMVRIRALELLVQVQEVSVLPQMVRLLRDPEDHVRERCLDLLHGLGNPDLSKHFIAAGDREEAVDLRVRMYEEALELGDPVAVDRLLALLENPEIPRRRKEKAYKGLAPHVEFPFGPEEVPRFRAWWEANRARVRWGLAADGQNKFSVER